MGWSLPFGLCRHVRLHGSVAGYVGAVGLLDGSTTFAKL